MFQGCVAATLSDLNPKTTLNTERFRNPETNIDHVIPTNIVVTCLQAATRRG